MSEVIKQDLKTEALKLALAALEESLGYVEEEAENAQRLYGQYPTRQARIQGLKDDARKHMDAIAAIRSALAEQPTVKDCLTVERPCTYPNCPYPCPDLPDCRDVEKPAGWFESPHGEFRANPLHKMEFPSSLVDWKIPLYTHPVREADDDLTIAYMSGLHRGKELARSEQPAQQEPLAWTSLLKKADEVVRSKSVWKRFIDGTPLANDIAVWMADFAQQHTSPQPAQPTKPLTMQERTSIVRANKSFHDKNEIDAYGIIDDVEAAHGIKGDA